MQFIFVLFVLYAAVLFIGCGFQRKFIFFPGKLERDYAFDLKDSCTELFLPTPDGAEINALFYRTPSDKAILYLHGNAGDLSSWQQVHHVIQQATGYNFLIIDYRGYGKSKGRISEDGLYIDAQTAYDYLLKQGFKKENIVIYGRSIGTGVATHLAANNPSKALVLETPFYNFAKLAHKKMPYLLPRLILVYRFRNNKKINEVKAPLLIIHGTNDKTIPLAHGQKLFDEFKGEKKMVIVRDGQHNNLSGFPEYQKALEDFFAEPSAK